MKRLLLAVLASLFSSLVQAQLPSCAPGGLPYCSAGSIYQMLGAGPSGNAGFNYYLTGSGPGQPPTWTQWLYPVQATNTLLGNVTGGTAAPVPISISQILDTLGYDIVRPPLIGSIVYKSAFPGQTWQALQPPQVAGWSLVSGGNGLDPVWAPGPTNIPPGLAGTCLTSNGVGVDPSYQPCLSGTSFSGLSISSSTWAGGAINGALIGNTTPSTGAFTVLAADSTVVKSSNGSVFDVVAYGADKTGAADARPAFVLALADAVAAGGGTIKLPCGTFLIVENTAAPNILTITTNNISFVGEGSCSIIKLSSSTATKFGITWAGGLFAQTYTLNANAVVGAQTITLTDATTVTPGMWLGFMGRDSAASIHFTVLRAFSKVGNVVTISGSLPFGLTTANNATNFIDNVSSWATGGGLRNLVVDGSLMNGLNPVCVSALRMREMDFDNVMFLSCKGSNPSASNAGGFLLQEGYLNAVGRIKAVDSGSSGISAIQIQRQAYCTGTDVSSVGASGFAIGYFAISDCNILATSSVGTHNSSRGIKLQMANRNAFGTMRAIGSVYTGVAFEFQSRNNTVASVIANENLYVAGVTPIPGNNFGLVFDGTGSVNNRIASVIALNNTDYDIVMADANNYIGNATITAFTALSVTANTTIAGITAGNTGELKSYVTGSGATPEWSINLLGGQYLALDTTSFISYATAFRVATLVSCTAGVQTDASGIFSCLPSTSALKHVAGALEPGKALANVMALRPMVGAFSQTPDTPEHFLVAEDVATVDPALAGFKNDVPYTVKPQNVIADLVAVAQHQQQQISKLQAANDNRRCFWKLCW